MSTQVSDLTRRLAEQAEMVCRHYLSNGRRSGNYWLVGDVNNTPGRSMFVRLTGPQSGKGVAGKWTDSATGQHGDLLDVIQLSCGLAFSDATERHAVSSACRLPHTIRYPPSGADQHLSAHRRRPVDCGRFRKASQARSPNPIWQIAASPTFRA
jgi:hypothetical protein